MQMRDRVETFDDHSLVDFARIQIHDYNLQGPGRQHMNSRLRHRHDQYQDWVHWRIFSRESGKSFGSKYARNIEAKKCHKEQFVPPPKLTISTFDDGGQYPPKVIISRC